VDKQKELLNKLVKGYAGRPEVEYIYTFGKAARDQADEYSDVDLVVVSRDLARLHGRFETVIEEVSAIDGSYTIVSTASKLARMYILKDYPPYQKIDLSIEADPGAVIFADKRQLYAAKAEENKESRLAVTYEKYTDRNQLYDILFSIPRFLKCLFRRDLTMYRRWNGMREYLDYMLYKTYVKDKPYELRNLNPYEHEQVLKKAPAEVKNELAGLLPVSGKPDIGRSFQGMMEMIVDLFFKTLDKGSVNMDFVKRMLGFMDSEIKRYEGVGE
jgi:predicted nucleotidyltransferase